MPNTDVETIVIGAGVIGLAVAATLAQHGQDVLVLERDRVIGQGVSSRNSEVIHAGIYYPPGSRKAALCVRGKKLLYRYCHDRHINAKAVGKLIVATNNDEIDALKTLRESAHKNGVTDIAMLTARQATDNHPGLHCVAALHSPSTGIVDSHALMTSLHADIEHSGSIVACNSEVRSISQHNGNLRVSTSDKTTLTAKHVINSAGLDAIALANTFTELDKTTVPDARYAKGNYFTLTGCSPFSTLIYPAPVSGGLGVHLTLDLAGSARFGPDVEWLGDPPHHYQVNPQRATSFYAAIRRYWPALPDNALVPAYAGIRPKIEWPDNAEIDFEISTVQQHNIDGLINLYGIESPGLTSALAIAEVVRDSLNNT